MYEVIPVWSCELLQQLSNPRPRPLQPIGRATASRDHQPRDSDRTRKQSSITPSPGPGGRTLLVISSEQRSEDWTRTRTQTHTISEALRHAPQRGPVTSQHQTSLYSVLLPKQAEELYPEPLGSNAGSAPPCPPAAQCATEGAGRGRGEEEESCPWKGNSGRTERR